MQPYRVAEAYDPLVLPLVPYDEVARHITDRIRAYREPRTILDVACGTGNLTIPMARLGFDVSGLDVAPGMLAIAREKAAGLDIGFTCQDMRAPYPGTPVDAVTCFFGALNFLSDAQALRQGFTAMYRALAPGGVLAFDLFPASRMRVLFAGTRATDHGDFFAVTRSEGTDHITHRVTFFVREPDGRYRREDELHRLTVHHLPDVLELLADVGFAVLSAEPFHVSTELLRDVALVIAQKPAET